MGKDKSDAGGLSQTTKDKEKYWSKKRRPVEISETLLRRNKMLVSARSLKIATDNNRQTSFRKKY